MMDEAIATESPPWNPAPPSPHAVQECEGSPIQSVKRELQEELERCSTQDSVGETIFSRSWLLSLLVKAVNYVQTGMRNADGTVNRIPSPQSGPSLAAVGHGAGKTSEVDSHHERSTGAPVGAVKGEGDKCGGRDVTVARKHGDHPFDDSGGGRVMLQPSDSGQCPHELDEDIENDMCKLWDTSVNKDVARFLVDNQAVSLLLGVACRSTAPRLTEICLGIIGNLACHEHLCQESLVIENNIHQVFDFLQDADTQVIYESLRLVQTCLGHPSVRGSWIDCIVRRESTIRLGLQFILQSSTVVDLLVQAGSLVDLLFTSSEELARVWSTQEFLQSLVEAVNQLRLSTSDPQCAAPYVFVLDVVSSLEEGAAVLVAMHGDVEDILLWFVVEGSSEVALEGEGASHCLTLLAACSVLLFLRRATAGEASTGVSGKTESSELLSTLKRIHHVLLEEAEGDACVPREGEVGVDSKDSSGGGAQPSSNLEQLRTVVSSLLELLQPVGAV